MGSVYPTRLRSLGPLALEPFILSQRGSLLVHPSGLKDRSQLLAFLR